MVPYVLATGFLIVALGFSIIIRMSALVLTPGPSVRRKAAALGVCILAAVGMHGAFDELSRPEALLWLQHVLGGKPPHEAWPRPG